MYSELPPRKFKFLSNLNDHLYKNAFFLMLNTLTGSGSGFLFWIIAARFYDPENVGLAVGIISSIGLLSVFTRFGLEIGIIRYLPNVENKISTINSCLNVVIISSLLFTSIFILSINFLSPKLVLIKENPFLILGFLLFSLASSIITIQNNIFAALRSSKYTLFQSLITMSRILLLPLFVSLNFVGIYFSHGIGMLVATFFGNTFIRRIFPNYKPFIEIKKEIISEMFHFSVGNYVAVMFEIIPGFVFPLLILYVLNSEMNAYFYVSWSFSSILFMIPKSTATSLFVEGSHSKNEFKSNVIKALKFTFILLIPMILILFFFGNYMLSLFGAKYAANAFEALRVFSVGCIFYSFNELYISIKRVQKETFSVILIYGVLMIFSIIFGYLLMKDIGLVGIAFGWGLSNVVVNILIGITLIKKL